MQHSKEFFILSPFELPDVSLALKTIETNAYAFLHLGRDKSQAEKALAELENSATKSFGVCFVNETSTDIKLPPNVRKVIYPFGVKLKLADGIEKYCQIHSMEEARKAIKSGEKNIIIKGNEGAGKVSEDSSFILFQRLFKEYSDKNINIYIQGGAGIHSSAATLALGAKGVIMDSQLAMFPECSASAEFKTLCKSLSGSETSVIDNFRVLVRNNSPKLPTNPEYSDILTYLGGQDISKNYLPLGQDVALSADLVENYKNLPELVAGFYESVYGHLLQAKKLKSIQADNKLAKSLGIKYPVAQGPMARVSDVPEFAASIAEDGALPFVAMSTARGDAARSLLDETSKLLGEKTWGVGILGFMPAQLRDEQTKYILEIKPKVVLIAGGRPSLAQPFEKAGIKTFLHVPSVALLDMFLKEGSKNFIFEGRESGGHIGPLSSLVLWERQINRLLKEEELNSISVFFAGGIHDAFSSALVSIMSATLAAKGAKIGILMGSSYLCTKEAVETGAILPQFQQQAISIDRTVILEAAPGQETHSLESPFTEFFQKEKKKLQSKYSDSKEVWLRLEELNLGRSRIATKGIERIGTDLVKLNEKEQIEKGLYMIGAVCPMLKKTLTLDELHTHVTVDNNKLIFGLQDISLPPSDAKPLDIAIVGISGIFPDAKNIEEYWRNIVMGKNSVTEVPDSRWNKEIFYDPDTRDTDYVPSKWGGFIPTIDFDPLEFGMTPQSLASIEPTQLLSLLVAKQALSDAGYTDLTKVDLENTSVIFGAEGATELAASYGFRASAKQAFGELPENVKNSLPRLNEDSFAGVLSNVISGRIANRLNLGGRNFTVDAACASSLAALDLSCMELHTKRSDMVLLGGADLHNGINDFLMFGCTHALSRKGYSASFDAESDGIALGEGIGVLVMKRLEDAERDGNKIYAVIKGVGGSSDGKSLGLTAPNRKGQMKALQRAYKCAGILPSQVGMIEAHGTGTVVGDKTELKALTDMFLESGAVAGQSLLGSVKTQIGHAKCAAGIAGVIKTALSLHYAVHPPTLHLKNPNPYYDKNTSPFVFNAQAGIWNSERRIAGVSAFGFGGTNFHVVMENYNKAVSNAGGCMPLWPSELFVFRGDSIEEAKEQLKKVKGLLNSNDSINIKNIAYSLSVYNNKNIQVSIIAGDHKELVTKIEAALSGKNEFGVYYRTEQKGKVAFMFSGQGSQRVNMARDLFVAFPRMRRLLAQNKEYEKIIFPNTAFDEETKKEQQKTITDTRNAQPLLGVVDFAIADFLRSIDIIPDMAAGHSYGEIPALCFAGVFSPDDLVSISRERALSILNAVGDDKGKMIAVNLPQEDLNVLLEGETEVWAVNFNSHKQTVLAGSTTGLTSFMEKLAKNNVGYKELNVACAFHSPLLSKSKDLFGKVISKIDFSDPVLPVWSNTTSKHYPQKNSEIKERLADHLVKPVLFTKEVENMYADGARIFIEAGPGSVLTSLVKSILGEDKVLTIDTENKAFNGVSYLLHAIAKYIATGKTASIEKLFDNRNATLLDLDNLSAYQKKPTIWYINGHNAVPANGKMPATGAYPITQPIMDLNNLPIQAGVESPASSSDHIVLEYLNNMKAMLQSQRDVMLGYLGHTPPPATTVIDTPVVQISSVPSQPVQHAPAPIQAEVTEVTEKAPVTNIDLKALLLDIVSEKTGYPADMLGMDLDLEADLSIDSIKRMEIIGALRDKLNISGSMEDAEDTVEKIASVKTLNGLVDWMQSLADEAQKNNSVATQSNNPLVNQENTVVEATANTSAHAIQFSEEDIKNLLLETVSEKTGYPVDMLGMDLDLEADLSIDSIKRMEIVGALRDKLNISGNMEDAEDTVEKIASVKTLNGLIDWMKELATGKTENQNTVTSATNDNIQKDPETENITENENIVRMTFELEEKALDFSNKLDINGKHFALTDDEGKFSKTVKKALEEKGAIVDLIKGDEKLDSYDGLIILNSFKSPKNYSIKEVFTMIKNTDTSKIKWIYVFSDLLGNIQISKDIADLKAIQGFPGLIKSLAQEFLEINFRAVVSYTLFDTKTLPNLIINELSVAETMHIEVAYKEGKRYFLKPNPVTLDTNNQSGISLDKDSVIVVFGGAQGITPELLTELASEYPCNYILVGRTERSSEEFDKYKDLDSKDKIRQYLIKQEQMRSPGEIERKVKKIFKINQINDNIRKIEQKGAKVTYVSLDIRDEKALKNFITETYKTYGKIDGIFHAAGLLDDKLFVHKTLESFEQVYSTKVTPLHVLLEELKPGIKLFVMFSSVASSYGNRGQTDYASANSVLDFTATSLSDKIDARVLTINWGPWKGTGMVSDSLESAFKERGVSLISLKAGAKYFVNELKYGKDNHILVMGGSDDVKNFIKSSLNEK